ncbi:Monooxygenase, FAD-binding protein [Cordyceps fumosorosea ARSEF 2679]|uniref:Monooxygenase, FAD-binding protein n=1 Tax=Cordyceps fumosorosea (strain ARSEF 2679) TaxID=1081104 RepID=A0A167ZM43_CORFA|nr:Monooxygenase, FAD-binding protein [Cordyceps fumosorosea ARSEF 2679]OAA67680.1 Monooxygenase, FAD-binding protein [Cordyceps fumosorosea ARSEF 2679]
MEIIIVGAGIAGLSLALALARSGHRVLVLEAAPALAEMGAGVQMTPLAMRYLFRWGMRDDVLDASIVPAEMLVRDGASGDVLAAIPTGTMEERYGGAPYIVVHRAVLHDLLHRHAIRAGAELRVDSRVVAYDFAAGAVELHDGTRLVADLVLGADGINSFARRQLLGDANADTRPTGLAAVRTMAEVAQMKADPLLADLADLETYRSHLWIAPGRSVMAYLIKEATLFNVVLSHPDDIDMSKFTPDEYRAFAQDLVKGFEPRVRRLIDTLLPKMQNFPVHAVPPLSRWAHASGRFALVGDAAHAMAFYLSMGVSMAVEDAASLIAVLDLACPAAVKGAAVDHGKLKTALKAFEEARKERVRIVQDASLHGGRMLHVEDATKREKVYAAMRADGLKDADGVSEATLATESLTYGLADQRVRDWCFAYDPVKVVKVCYEAIA